MAKRNGKVYRDIGLEPDNNEWVSEQAGGERRISEIVNKCITRTRRQSDALDRIDRLAAEIARLSGAMVYAQERLSRMTAFLEFQVWKSVGENDVRFDAWMDEFEKFNQPEEQTNAAE